MIVDKSNADTTNLSHKEIEKHDLHGSKQTPGSAGKYRGSNLGQKGGPALKQAGNYPLLLGVTAVVVGLGTVVYYRSSHPEKKGQSGVHSPALEKSEKSKKAAT